MIRFIAGGSPHHITERLFYDHLTIPILAIGMSDDPIGSPSPIERLHRLFRQALEEYKTTHPADMNTRQIAHFGFFLRQFADVLRPEVLPWLQGKG